MDQTQSVDLNLDTQRATTGVLPCPSARKVGLSFASVLKRRILWNLLPVDSNTKAYEEQILVPSSRNLSFRVLASVISLIMRFVPSWRSSLLGVGNWLKTHVCIASASV